MSQVYHRLLRWILGLFFAATGAVKFYHLRAFAQDVSEFGILLDDWVTPFAILVCLVELLGGIGMVFAIRGAWLSLFAALICFVMALLYGIYLGLDIDCGCLGPGWHVSLTTQLLIDMVLLSGMLAIKFTSGERSPSDMTEQTESHSIIEDKNENDE